MLPFNCSELIFENENWTALVRDVLGPRCMMPEVALSTEIIYSAIFLCGFFGNVFTCIVILKNTHMHTTTNCYLFSLALSDLCSLILGIPFELYDQMTAWYPYQLPEAVCKFRAFITEMTSYASVLTITAFTFERWLAICFPFRVQARSKASDAVRTVIGIWIASFICAMPMLLFMRINFLIDDTTGLKVPETDFCGFDQHDKMAQLMIVSFSFWLFFALPLLTMIVLYAYIGRAIYFADRARKADSESHLHSSKHSQSRKIVIKMLVAVCAAFFICWLPFHLQRLFVVFMPIEAYSSTFVQTLTSIVFYISGYFYYSNSAINPILYNALNAKFRQAFFATICAVPCTGSFQSTIGASENSPSPSANSNRCVRNIRIPAVTLAGSPSLTPRRHQSGYIAVNTNGIHSSESDSGYSGNDSSKRKRQTPYSIVLLNSSLRWAGPRPFGRRLTVSLKLHDGNSQCSESTNSALAGLCPQPV